MSAARVNVENFTRAETNRMFHTLGQAAGGVNTWGHYRQPTPLDKQTVIRMNQDTLYSFAVVDIRQGATITIPDAGNRYLSVMVINQDHYINKVIHAPGEHELTLAEFDTPYVLVAARTLVDPANAEDVAEVNALQDQMTVTAASAESFSPPDVDAASLDATRDPLLELARGLSGYDHTFGRRDDVDPVRHLIGTAAGWGGLPESEAFYVNVDPGLPVAEYELTVKDVPVDAFWSISLYNAEGFFQPNSRNRNSVNSITAVPNSDGSTTVRFGTSDEDAPNYLPIMEGWNYIVRLYRPHAEIVNGAWAFPSVTPA
jgi:hypothetical protein